MRKFTNIKLLKSKTDSLKIIKFNNHPNRTLQQAIIEFNKIKALISDGKLFADRELRDKLYGYKYIGLIDFVDVDDLERIRLTNEKQLKINEAKAWYDNLGKDEKAHMGLLISVMILTAG